MLLAVLAGAVCVAVAAWYHASLRRFRAVLAIPGPAGVPLLGNVLDMGATPVELLKSLESFMRNFGNTTKIKILTRVFVISRDPKFIEFVLASKHITKSTDYTFLHPWLGNGLLTSTGNFWKSRRKILTPAFHFKILEQFIDTFDSSGDVLIDKLKEVSDGRVVDVYPFVTRYALDVICETAMGTTVNAQNDTESVYMQSVKDACNVILHRTFSAWKQFYPLFLFSSDYRLQKNALRVMHGFTKQVISRRRAELLASGKQEERDEFGAKRKAAFLDILLTATVDGQPLSDDDIREEVDTFMFEGHDTTASGISFCLYAIANHMGVQDKIVQEIKTIFHDDLYRPATHKDLSEMKYLEMVIKESLRLYPSVPFIARELQEDAEYNGILLPKGLTLTMYIYSMHRNPELFKDPERFDPDRFLPENANKNPYVYVPFSAGLRNCIGQKFAMMEMKSAICKVLRHYVLRTAGPENGVVLSSEVVLKSANGVRMRVTPRDL